MMTPDKSSVSLKAKAKAKKAPKPMVKRKLPSGGGKL